MNYSDRKKSGEMLRRIRKDQGFTIENLADDYISASTISNIERGNPYVSIEKINYYAKKLDVGLEELSNLTTEEKKNEKKYRLQLMSIENMIDLVDPNAGLARLRQLNSGHFSCCPGMINYLKGKSYYRKNKEKAETYFLKAIQQVDQHPNLEKSNIKSICYNELGTIYFYKNELEQALHYTQKGIDAFVPDGERSYVKSMLLANKAIYLEDLGRLEESIQTIEQLRSQPEEFKSTNSTLSIYVLQARIYHRNKLYSQAIACTETGIELARINRMYERSSELWTLLGNIHFSLQKLEEAEICYLTALDIKEKIRKEHLLITPYTQLGLLYLEQNKYTQAQQALEEAVKIGERSDHILPYIGALIALGNFYLKQKKYYQAIQPFEKALTLAQKHNSTDREEEIVVNLCYCYEQIGDIEKFQNYSKRLVKVKFRNNQKGIECI
ncbi:helix-turn-helix domain-containing protein [Thermoflavimicrobium dichotomicum]|uniref:Tetratricopeptide repeat-containing protein n=1 Tax=Thermoflavimicrobium dichotomicum TaxID=46223 RepID=A0A1I3MG08_9BACL|nr:helix-turn-helix domain-containing protein [Thermoflavimicrobium dichotomicum]SFI95893.1 Tetratricopeptide repeat-containing protein [Thermoflavimicrobium dichotomicum]